MVNALRYVGKKGCAEKAYAAAITEPPSDLLVLDLVSRSTNIVLRATLDDDKRLYLRTAPDVRDFRDITVMSYVLDTLARRSEAGDYWSREFHCSFPVRNPGLWGKHEGLLSDLLSFLAGDNYQFTWMQAAGLPAHRKHHGRIPKGYDCVCLFSGGVDSLLGAYELLSAGKRLLLVGHQSEPVTASTQKELFVLLSRLFPKQARFIQFRVSVARKEEPLFSIPDVMEDTHRVRSFLFLGLAISVANMAGISEIHMPENGLIALNPPLDCSRLGTCSTRTAHPRFLAEVLQFAKSLGVFSGSLKNPFLYESKTDMLRSLDPKLKPALIRSVSCARPSRYQNRGVRHCGYCVPCVYRRAAFAASGLDDAGQYAFDVFTGFANLTEKTRLDFASLVTFARTFKELSPLQKEAAVVSHGYFSPDLGKRIGPKATADYSPWVQMLDRWTSEFLSLIQAKASVPTKESLRWSEAANV